jgi:hypothetical protein
VLALNVASLDEARDWLDTQRSTGKAAGGGVIDRRRRKRMIS